MPQYGIQAMGMLSVHNHSNLTQGGAVPVGSLAGHNDIIHNALDIDADTVDGIDIPSIIANILTNHTKPVHDGLAINAGQVDGIEGAEIIQRDGSVPLTAPWLAGDARVIQIGRITAKLGGNIILGDVAGSLRIVRDSAEIIKILGESNAECGLKLSDAMLEGKLRLTSPTELTIAGGAITVTKSYHTVDTQGEAPADDLVTINGGTDGMMLIIRTVNSGRDITIKDTGNILLRAADRVMGLNNYTAAMIYDSTLGKWIELGEWP